MIGVRGKNAASYRKTLSAMIGVRGKNAASYRKTPSAMIGVRGKNAASYRKTPLCNDRCAWEERRQLQEDPPLQ